jgi:hypothetical protein
MTIPRSYFKVANNHNTVCRISHAFGWGGVGRLGRVGRVGRVGGAALHKALRVSAVSQFLLILPTPLNFSLVRNPGVFVQCPAARAKSASWNPPLGVHTGVAGRVNPRDRSNWAKPGFRGLLAIATVSSWCDRIHAKSIKPSAIHSALMGIK